MWVSARLGLNREGDGDRRRDLTRPGGHHAPSLPNSSNSSSHSGSTATFFLGSSFCSVIARVRSSRPRVSLWRPGGDFGRSDSVSVRRLAHAANAGVTVGTATPERFCSLGPPPPPSGRHTRSARLGAQSTAAGRTREERAAESEARARSRSFESFVEARRATRRFARSHPLARSERPIGRHESGRGGRRGGGEGGRDAPTHPPDAVQSASSRPGPARRRPRLRPSPSRTNRGIVKVPAAPSSPPRDPAPTARLNPPTSRPARTPLPHRPHAAEGLGDELGAAAMVDVALPAETRVGRSRRSQKPPPPRGTRRQAAVEKLADRVAKHNTRARRAALGRRRGGGVDVGGVPTPSAATPDSGGPCSIRPGSRRRWSRRDRGGARGRKAAREANKPWRAGCDARDRRRGVHPRRIRRRATPPNVGRIRTSKGGSAGVHPRE